MTDTHHIVYLFCPRDGDGPKDIAHLHCNRCGADLCLKLPMSVDEVVAASEAFVAWHKGCEETKP